MVQDDNNEPTTKTIDELMARTYPETTYLVDRLIPAESITILSGQSRSFKTYTLLDIAIAVASELPLFEHFQTTQANVLIINEEDGERLLQKRFQQLGIEQGHGLPIHISALTNFKLEDKHIEEVLAFCKDKVIGLVIIDSLIRVHNADENSAREMSKVFAQLRKFTKAHIAVLVTQHHRKTTQNSTGGASEMRGSSDILAAVDSHVGVRRDKLSLTFSQEKQRYDVELDPFKVDVTINADNFKFEYAGTTLKRDTSTVLAPIAVGILKEHGRLTTGEFLTKLKAEADKENVKLNEHSFRDLTEQWIKAGYVPTPVKGKGNTLYYMSWEALRNEQQ